MKTMNAVIEELSGLAACAVREFDRTHGYDVKNVEHRVQSGRESSFVARLLGLCLVTLGAVFLFAATSWGQTKDERGYVTTVAGGWTPAVQQEWERFGGKYFQSVPANQPHSTLRLRDSANRAGVGPFDVWLLINGKRVKSWASAGSLRISPRLNCIRVEMVSVPQRYQGTLARFWPWETAESKAEVRFSGDSRAGFTAKYQPMEMVMGREGSINPKRMKFVRDLPKNPEDAYAYCLENVRGNGRASK